MRDKKSQFSKSTSRKKAYYNSIFITYTCKKAYPSLIFTITSSTSYHYHATIRDSFEKEICGAHDKNYDDNKIVNDKFFVEDLSENENIQSTISGLQAILANG